MNKIIFVLMFTILLSGCGVQYTQKKYNLYRVYHDPTKWKKVSIICNNQDCIIDSDQKYFTPQDQQNLEKFFCSSN